MAATVQPLPSFFDSVNQATNQWQSVIWFQFDLAVGTQVKLPGGLGGDPLDGNDKIIQMSSYLSCHSFSRYLFGVKCVWGVMYSGIVGKELLFLVKYM